MRLHTGWGKGERDFSEKEFKNSWIKKNYGSTFSYDKYLEARLRMKLNEKRRKAYALKRKATLKEKMYGYKLGNVDKEVNKLLGDIF